MEHNLRNSEVRTELAHLVLDCTSMREFGIEIQVFSAPALSLHPCKDGGFIPLSEVFGECSLHGSAPPAALFCVNSACAKEI